MTFNIGTRVTDINTGQTGTITAFDTWLTGAGDGMSVACVHIDGTTATTNPLDRTWFHLCHLTPIVD